MDGLLGVAGMMKLIVSQWIIPENSLRLAPVSNVLLVKIGLGRELVNPIYHHLPILFWCFLKKPLYENQRKKDIDVGSMARNRMAYIIILYYHIIWHLY